MYGTEVSTLSRNIDSTGFFKARCAFNVPTPHFSIVNSHCSHRPSRSSAFIINKYTDNGSLYPDSLLYEADEMDMEFINKNSIHIDELELVFNLLERHCYAESERRKMAQLHNQYKNVLRVIKRTKNVSCFCTAKHKSKTHDECHCPAVLHKEKIKKQGEALNSPIRVCEICLEAEEGTAITNPDVANISSQTNKSNSSTLFDKSELDKTCFSTFVHKYDVTSQKSDNILLTSVNDISNISNNLLHHKAKAGNMDSILQSPKLHSKSTKQGKSKLCRLDHSQMRRLTNQEISQTKPAVLCCAGCGTCVHLECYCASTSERSATLSWAKTYNNGNWFCDRCSFLAKNERKKRLSARNSSKLFSSALSIPCSLCGRVGGALKPFATSSVAASSKEYKWCHVLCGLCTDGITLFSNGRWSCFIPSSGSKQAKSTLQTKIIESSSHPDNMNCDEKESASNKSIMVNDIIKNSKNSSWLSVSDNGDRITDTTDSCCSVNGSNELDKLSSIEDKNRVAKTELSTLHKKRVQSKHSLEGASKDTSDMNSLCLICAKGFGTLLKCKYCRYMAHPFCARKEGLILFFEGSSYNYPSPVLCCPIHSLLFYSQFPHCLSLKKSRSYSCFNQSKIKNRHMFQIRENHLTHSQLETDNKLKMKQLHLAISPLLSAGKRIIHLENFKPPQINDVMNLTNHSDKALDCLSLSLLKTSPGICLSPSLFFPSLSPLISQESEPSRICGHQYRCVCYRCRAREVSPFGEGAPCSITRERGINPNFPFCTFCADIATFLETPCIVARLLYQLQSKRRHCNTEFALKNIGVDLLALKNLPMNHFNILAAYWVVKRAARNNVPLVERYVTSPVSQTLECFDTFYYFQKLALRGINGFELFSKQLKDIRLNLQSALELIEEVRQRERLKRSSVVASLAICTTLQQRNSSTRLKDSTIISQPLLEESLLLCNPAQDQKVSLKKEKRQNFTEEQMGSSLKRIKVDSQAITFSNKCEQLELRQEIPLKRKRGRPKKLH